MVRAPNRRAPRRTGGRARGGAGALLPSPISPRLPLPSTPHLLRRALFSLRAGSSRELLRRASLLELGFTARNGGAGMASGAAGPRSLPRFDAAASPSLRGGVTSSCAGGAGTASWSCAREGGGRKSSRRRPFAPSSAGGSSPGRPPRPAQRGGRGCGRRRARDGGVRGSSAPNARPLPRPKAVAARRSRERKREI